MLGNTQNNYKNDWNAYWQTGLSTSCISNHKHDEYPAAIKSFWIDSFLPLITSNSMLLDLCSGGGGIPKLLLDSINNTTLSLDCISSDYTNISHDKIIKDKMSITFAPNCNCEKLPYKKHSFDFVTSSYGIEYSDINKTIEEINWVLKPKGVFSAVIHAEASEIISNSRQQQNQGKYILKELNYFNLFRRVYLAKRQSKPFQNKVEKKFKRCLEKIKSVMLVDENNLVFSRLLTASQEIFFFGQAHSITKTIEYIDKSEEALMQNIKRMENLLNIANDTINIKTTIQYFKQQGYKILFNNQIKNNDKIVGFGLICKKAKPLKIQI